MTIDPSGFRKDTKQLFKQFTMTTPTTEKQPAPFIVVEDGETKKVNTVDELLKMKNGTEVLQTWPGKVRSDIFYFKVKDLKDHIKKGG